MCYASVQNICLNICCRIFTKWLFDSMAKSFKLLLPIDIFKVVLTQLPGQELTLEILDRDMDMKDDFMGRYEGCR